jgi:hypothetical protein
LGILSNLPGIKQVDVNVVSKSASVRDVLDGAFTEW